ncbi:hypothetical protein Tco_0838192 [Tanacetum coccineum]|uniref:Uncharacterized protein n=1 Tax=Tanacetum coccineum TaxID=301880 RepID=A0ABQ5AM19_9ASTR
MYDHGRTLVETIQEGYGLMALKMLISGVEEFQLDNLSRLVSTITLSSAVDRYVWSLENSGEFSVKSIRQVIDANCFPVIHSATRWVKSVPLKVNIMA